MTKPRVMLISDVRGWAFDQNMHDLAEYLTSFEFDHFYVDEFLRRTASASWPDFDGVFECYHLNPAMGVPRERTVGALRSQWFKPEQKGPPDAQDIALVNSYGAFQVAIRSVYDEIASRCPNAAYLTNPINMRRFPSVTPLRDAIVAEWNGNPEHKSNGRRIKHFYDVVVPACQRAGVTLHSAEYTAWRGDSRRRALAEMPEFYLQANVALCASDYEAASNSVLEAMASGLAVIATDVGNHREMRDAQKKAFGDSGILFVDGSVESFVAALGALTPARAREMGAINRAEIEARWSWDVWAPRYAEVLRKVVRRPKVIAPVRGASESTLPSAVRVPVPLAVSASVPVAVAPVPVPVTPASVVAIPVDFSYWEKVDPKGFLSDDWDNPSRAWAGRTVAAAIERGCRTMVEAGPGVGVDYDRQFKRHVLEGRLVYSGFEGSSSFCAHLSSKHPEALWVNRPLTELTSRGFDVVYTRAVLEHQPALEPSLSYLLGAASKLAIVIWYRRPDVKAVSYVLEGVHYNTFNRDEVLDVVARAGWKLIEETPFDSGNLGWVLERANAQA